MAALADIWKVQVRYRPLADSELAAVTDLLDFASAVARRLVPSIDDRVDGGTLDADLVAGVVAGAVVRVLRNRSTSTRDALELDVDAPAPDIWDNQVKFTKAEVALLSPGPARSVRSVNLAPGIGYPYRTRPCVRRAW